MNIDEKDNNLEELVEEFIILTSSASGHFDDALCLAGDFSIIEGSYPHRHLYRRHFPYVFNSTSGHDGGGAGD